MRLMELAEAFESANEMIHVFYDRENDELALVSDEAFTLSDFLAEADLKGFEESERKAVMTVWAIRDNPDRFAALPDNREQQIGDLMRDFAFAQDDKACDAILDGIRGRENVGRFEKVIDRFGLRKEWQEFKNKGYERMVAVWCEEKGIPLEE